WGLSDARFTEPGLRLDQALGAGDGGGLGRLLVHAGRPDLAGCAPGLDGPDAALHPRRVGAGARRLLRVRRVAERTPGARAPGRVLHLLILVAGVGRVDLGRLRPVDGRAGVIYHWALDPLDLGPGTGRHDLVRPPCPGSDVRPRPDQRDADALPGHRAERTGPLGRSVAGLAAPWRGGDAAVAEYQCEPGPAADPGPHVRHLLLRRDFETPGRGLVERRGGLAIVREPRVPVDRHDLAGLAPLGLGPPHARLRPLGDLLLHADLAAATA